jgi:glycosyltransferase involved in cell wall biosynthesis
MHSPSNCTESTQICSFFGNQSSNGKHGMKPLVSVIIPAYNRERTIAKAIQSVQSQTYTEWEAIIVDDGSTDATSKIVRRMAEQDNRIRLLRHSVNRGAQAARNTGIKAAKGTWVSFLDSDDEWLPNSLIVRLERALTDKVAVVHSGGYILMSGKELKPYRVTQPSGKVYNTLLANENPMFQALLVSKRAIERIGYLDEKIVSFQEWDTYIRLAKFYKFAFVPEPTFVYDYQTKNAISRNDLRAACGYRRVVKKHFFSILIYAGLWALFNHYGIIAEYYRKGGNYRMANILKLRLLLLVFYPQGVRNHLSLAKEATSTKIQK